VQKATSELKPPPLPAKKKITTIADVKARLAKKKEQRETEKQQAKPSESIDVDEAMDVIQNL
jgi:hypothetical protein